MSVRSMWFAGAVVLGLSSVAPAGAADVLTLARVRQLAAADQPQLVAQSAAVQAARETAVAEAQLPDPRLKLGLQNVPVDGFALNREPMTQAIVAVEQMLPGGNKRALRAARAEAEASQMTAELDARQRQIERDAALAFVALRGAQRQLDIARRLSRESANQVESMAPALRTGKSSQADYYAARNMVTMAHHREVELAAQVGRARADLSRWIGVAANEPLADEAELPLPPPRPLARVLDAMERHPEHATAAQAVGVADAEVALAREAGRPDKSIEIGYGRRARAFGDMVSIQFAMDLPLFQRDRQDRGVAARVAQRERALALQQDHLRALRAEMAGAWNDWQSAQERLRLIGAEHVPDAAARTESALAAYRGGRGEMAAVIEARRGELEALLLQAEVQAALERSRVQLAYYESSLGDTP